MRKHLRVALFVTISCSGIAQGADKIRYEALVAQLGNDIVYRGFNVVTLDGKEHGGRRLHLEYDHVRLFHLNNSWEDLPSDQISRIEIYQSGRFFHHIAESAAIPVAIAKFLNGGLESPGYLSKGSIPVIGIFSPVWAYTAVTAPFYLAADGVAFFLPSRVYEIVH